MRTTDAGLMISMFLVIKFSVNVEKNCFRHWPTLLHLPLTDNYLEKLSSRLHIMQNKGIGNGPALSSTTVLVSLSSK